MKILMVGDIVGGVGRTVFARAVAVLKGKGQADFVIANAENAAGGKGLTRPLAEELFAAGADVLTLGDHTWDQKDLVAGIDNEPRILRPANFAPGNPGRGWYTAETPSGRVTVINLVGRIFMPPVDCPFRAADAILAREPNLGRMIVVDVHAEATSEKVALGRYLDGRVSAVVGTHTHVQTADERVSAKGTACITDVGMTGPKDSIIGREAESVMNIFLKGMPAKFEVATGDVTLEGAIIDVDPTTGKANKISRIRDQR